ncbi:MAG TPA: RDD family protein [Miltoncostaeaceae bacterium]|nr:RDD family protein [Miltoncostaeaceae bacterium]
MTLASSTPAVRARQGMRAGLASRLSSAAIDVIVWIFLMIGLVILVAGIRALFTGTFELEVYSEETRGPVATLVLLAYLAYGWGLNGRTVGMVLMGLRAVGRDGSDLSPWRGFWRAALYLIFLPGILWVLVSRKNASIQDLLLRTAVVYDWGHTSGGHVRPPPG